MELVVDASPWGLGGVLVVDGAIVSYFSSELSEEDFRRFNYERGSHEGQQAWESLGALVALRLYKDRWLHHRVRLTIRGDSVAMLTLVIKMRPPTSSPALGLISREIALDVAEGVYSPDVVCHTPGMANIYPDMLSREFEPGAPFVLPAALSRVPRIEVPVRSESFYRTL